MATILLASASPRRAELLAQLGVKFNVEPMNIDERRNAREAPIAYVSRMARAKAAAAINHLEHYSGARQAVLAADTIVVAGASERDARGRVLGKPRDASHAVQMLCDLGDRTHQVYTAVAVRFGVQQAFVCVCTDVRFRSVSMQEARAYWSTGEPADKAGGYGIQGAAIKFVNKIDGSYTNVVGLPLFETRCALRALQLLD